MQKQVAVNGKVSSIETFWVDALSEISLEIENMDSLLSQKNKLITTMNHPTWIKNKK